MIRIIKKREDGRLLIGIVLDPQGLQKRAQLVKLGLKIIFSNPEKIAFEEKDNAFSFYFSQQKKLPLGGLDNAKKKRAIGIGKKVKRFFVKERFVKSAAGLTIFALVFQFAAIMPRSHNEALAVAEMNNSMCAFNTDALLAIDITQSMNDGSQPSSCEWENYEWVPAEETNKCIDHQEQGLSEEECMARDDGAPQCTFGPVYTPPVPSKLEAAKQAAQGFVDNLKTQDQSGVISFAGSANLDKTISFDHNNTKSIISGLTVQSSTNTDIAGAINKAIEEFSSERARVYALHTLILLSDGSDINTALVTQKTQEALEAGIRIFTIGLGENANQGQLQQIAQTTGGSYYYASSQQELENIYNQIAQQICGLGDECEQSETPGECVADGEREIAIGWNYDFCGEPSTLTEDDETCACEQEEADRTCIADGIAQVTYTWNYNYCGDDPEPETEADDDCACIYSDWQDGDCVGDGLREQTRTAISEFGYCQDLTQTIDDPTCAQEPGEEEGEEQGGGEEGEEGGQEPVLGSISGYKYNDLNKNSQIDEGEPAISGWTILLEKEEKEVEGWQVVAQTTTNDQGYYIFENLEEGNYRVSEVLPEESNWEQTYPENSSWEVSLQEGDNISDINFANYQPVCGNSILDEDEQCDDGNLLDGDGCSSLCQIEEQQQGGGGEEQVGEEEGGEEQEGEGQEEEQGGQQGQDQEGEEQGDENQNNGGGVNVGGLGGVVLMPGSTGNGGTSPSGGSSSSSGATETEEPLEIVEGSIAINQRQVQEGENYNIIITWETTHPASSQVIYAKEGEEHTFDINDNQGNPPKYGYAHTTPEYDINPKVTFHSVTISGLEPGATYYFRCVSRGSFIVSDEQTFVVRDLAKVKKIVEMQKDLAKIEAQLTLIGYEVEKMNQESKETGEEIGQEEQTEETLSEEKPGEVIVKPQETDAIEGTAQAEKKSLVAALGLLSQGAKIGLIILIVAVALLLYYLLYFRKKRRRG